MKEVLAMLEKLNPNARSSMWGALTNIQSEYLPKEV
jgi:hypothetical protein